MSNQIVNCRPGTMIVKDGSTRHAMHQRRAVCNRCDGIGTVPVWDDMQLENVAETCPICKGAKMVYLELNINVFPAE